MSLYTIAAKERYMNLIENPDQARRLARAIISDVALYNREKGEEGIKNDTIFEVLQEALQEGRDHFVSRVSPEVTSSNVSHIARGDVLIKRAGKIESEIW